MVLMITSFTVGSGMFSPRQKLEESLNDIERAIRFAADEAVIRNTITRVTFQIDKEPNEFSVEFGPDENFILPRRVTSFAKSLSLREKEAQEKDLKKLSNQFSKVQEFKGGAFELSDQVKIIAIGSTLGSSYFTDGEASIYFYPSGEKDSAIIIISTEIEIAALASEAFTMDFDKTITPLDENSTQELYELQLKMAKDFHEKWSKQ